MLDYGTVPGRRLVLLSAAVLLAVSMASCGIPLGPDPGIPGEFFIDSAYGDDANAGVSPEAPWKSLGMVIRGTVPPGSVVRLRSGSVWRERLYPKMGVEGAPVTYTSYGDGAKPLLLGSLQASVPENWVRLSGTNLWRAGAGAELDVGNILWVSAEGDVLAYGHKKWSRSDCSAQGDFWYNKADDSVELFSGANPASLYSGASVELAMGTSIVTMSDRAWMVFDGLDLRFAGGYGFQGKSVSHVIIRNCDISWIGGSELLGLDRVRYGNGVEFFADASDCLVENNRVFEMYDTALTNQCYLSASQTDITYRNNAVWNCGYASIEVWNRGVDSVTENIVIEHNSCRAAGEGWGGDPGRSNTDTSGAHLRFDEVSAATDGFVVRGNVFSEARVSGALVMVPGGAADGWRGWPSLVMDNNCWHDSDGTPLWTFFNVSTGIIADYGMSELAGYRAALGKEAHSIAADPLFIDASSNDLGLAASSPCVGAGPDTGLAADIDGRPRGNPPDIGAFERS